MDVNYSIIIKNLSQCGQGPYAITLALGPITNMCVIWLILAGPKRRVMDISCLNQALCELVICAVIVAWFSLRNTVRHAVLAEFYFRYTIQFSFGLLFSGRPALMSWVCLERYLAVVHPVTFLKYNNLTYRAAGAIIVWLMVLVCSLSLSWMTYPTIYYVCFGMCSPWFVLQLFCSVEMLRALVRPGPGDGNRERKRMPNGAKLSALRVIVINLLCEAVTYAPTAAAVILFSLNKLEETLEMYCISVYFMVFSAVIPPLIFINRARKYCCKDTT